MNTPSSPGSLKSTSVVKNVAALMRSSRFCLHPGQRGSQQRAAEAVADRRDLALAGRLLDGVQRRQRTLEHVVLERHLAELLVRVDPRQDEGREALVDAELDEAVLGLQIEDVELVDPGRHDHQRPPVYLLGRRRVLDQLHQVGLEHDLARRRRDVAADLERVEVGHLDREPALAALEILQHVLEAAQQVLAAGLEGQPQDLGIGRDEVRGRHHLDELARVELELLLGLVVQPVLLAGDLQDVFGAQQVGLLDEVEQRVVVPGGVLEPPVARGRERSPARHRLPSMRWVVLCQSRT